MDLGKDWAVCAAQFSRAFGLYPDRDDRGIAQRRGTLYEKKMKEPEGGILTLEFFHAFAADVKQATGAWLVLASVMVLGAGDIYYAIRIAEPVNMFFYSLAACFSLWQSVCSFWIFPLVANYDNRVQKGI